MESPAGQQQTIEYTALATSALINGQVKLTVGKDSLSIAALFDTLEIVYAQINALTLSNYSVTIKADVGDFDFSRMGSWCEPFYVALCAAYSQAVLRSLFVSGDSLLSAKADYHYVEGELIASGSAPVHVYQNSVVVLSPNLEARRVPLCFVSNINRDAYQLTIQLNTKESYTFARLGYDTLPFVEQIEQRIRALHQESLAVVKQIDPTLTAAQAMTIAKLVPEGVAASIEQLSGIAPSFVAALEKRISATCAADNYRAFKEMSDHQQIYVGFRKNDTPSALDALGNSGTPSATDVYRSPLDSYLLWLIAPSPSGQFAAVEFAEANFATFIYRTGGDFTAFARQLNQSLEAIAFKREAIRLSGIELLKPENADYLMAAKRTAALRFIRDNFVGRIIHSSTDTWQHKLAELWK
jgi:hypothetical protein